MIYKCKIACENHITFFVKYILSEHLYPHRLNMCLDLGICCKETIDGMFSFAMVLILSKPIIWRNVQIRKITWADGRGSYPGYGCCPTAVIYCII